MRDTLRTLHALVTPNPRLATVDGVSFLAFQDGSEAMFPGDNDAAFFAEAYREVPALLDAVDLWQARCELLKQGRIEELERVVSERDTQLRRLEGKLAETEKLLEQETKLRTVVQRRARKLALAIVHTSKNAQSHAQAVLDDKAE